MKKFLMVIPAALLVCGLSVNSFGQQGAEQKLDALMEDYWAQYLAQNPITANLQGEPGNSDKLRDLSEQGFKQEKALLDKYLAAIEGIRVEKLGESSKQNYRLFEWVLSHERKTLDFDWRYFTFTTYSGWHDGFAQSVPEIRMEKSADFENYLKRLSGFPEYANQNIRLMRLGIESGYTQPCDALEGYGEGIRGYIQAPEESNFYKPFLKLPKTLSSQEQASLRKRALEVIERKVIPQYRSYAEFYEKQYLPACRKNVGLSSLNGGAELYDHFVKYYTTTDTTAEKVHQLGLSEVKRIRADMEKVIAELEYKGDFKSFLNYLRTDPKFYPKTAEAYMAAAASIAKKVDGMLPEYFSYLPRNPYGIEKIPDQIAPKVTPAYYQRGAADGTRAGKYFINTYDLKSRALYELPALTLHEAVPGHHLQISIQSELQGLPEFRRFYYFHPFGEGWGLYAEYLGEEMGLYTTPYERFGRMTYEMWRALRLVVDTGMHAKGWSRQQAIDFMAENSALSMHNITTEVDRYITWPGQALAYKMGELKIREMRSYAEKSLGEQFDLREFHTQVLTSGAVPLSVLELQIKNWVAEQPKN